MQISSYLHDPGSILVRCKFSIWKGLSAEVLVGGRGYTWGTIVNCMEPTSSVKRVSKVFRELLQTLISSRTEVVSSRRN